MCVCVCLYVCILIDEEDRRLICGLTIYFEFDCACVTSQACFEPAIDRESWTVQSMYELYELDRSATTAPTSIYMSCVYCFKFTFAMVFPGLQMFVRICDTEQWRVWLYFTTLLHISFIIITVLLWGHVSWTCYIHHHITYLWTCHIHYS